MNRLFGSQMATEPDAENFDPATGTTQDIIEDICQRAAILVGRENANLVRDRLMAHRDDWAYLAEELLRYSWLDDARRPPNNSRVLFRTSSTQNEGEWSIPGSLREVEPTAAFYLDEGEALSMTTRAIGSVRPSQVITTFGPGAIVDLQMLSVIIAGIDTWPDQ